MEDHVGYSLGEDDIKKEDINGEMKLESGKLNCQEPSRLQCHVCNKVMGHRSSLYKHLKYVHKIEPAHRLPITCKEKDCFQSFTFIDPFRKHLAVHHGFDIVVEKYVFQSMTDFFNWKKVTEQQENVRFIVSTGPRSSKNGKTHYFRCQKNGVYKPEIKKRLQAHKRDSIYNASTTHCISSMFVFEEPECVTVEFCRTHYGHDLNSNNNNNNNNNSNHKEKKKKKESNDTSSGATVNESNINYEVIESYDQLTSLLSEKDKTALVTILNENQHLLEETEELFYENEHDVILKIPFAILKNLMEEGINRDARSDDDTNTEDPLLNTDDSLLNTEDSLLTTIEGDNSCDETVIEKLDDEDLESEDGTILKSLGNGIFLDPASNKRLKLDSLKKKTKFLEKKVASKGDSDHREQRRKDWEKNTNTMLVKEYLNEFDEKVYVLEPIKVEETVVQKREKILSQLQTILMMVNSEDDADVLDDIRNHLSKYAVPE